MSDIEARREARRRKILENSAKRLQKITGLEQRNVSYEIDGFKSLPENHVEEETVLSNCEPQTLLTSNECLGRNQLHLPHENGACGAPLYQERPASIRNTPNPTQIVCLKTHRVQIIFIMSFLVNILTSTVNNPNLYALNKIFIPLLCFEAMYMFYNQEENSDWTKYLVFFRNIPQNQMLIMVKYLNIAKTVLRDVMIYFFVFVCLLFIRSLFTNDLYISFVL